MIFLSDFGSFFTGISTLPEGFKLKDAKSGRKRRTDNEEWVLKQLRCRPLQYFDWVRAI
jgi:hypothetical protein